MLIERRGLGYGTRVAVGHKAIGTVVLAKALGDNFVDQVVGHQLAAQNVGLGDLAQRCFFANGFP